MAEYHLPHLTDEVCLWEPAPGSWTVRQSAGGSWRPDWAEAEPDPAPPTTIGWLTWHLIWWWSGLLAAVRNEPVQAREQVFWPGTGAATSARLDQLHTDWSDELQKLSSADLDRSIAYPWPEPRALRIVLAWANSEMMKNVGEIGCVRHLFAADQIQRRTARV